MFADPPFGVGGDPSVTPVDFRVTTFATGLSFPYGMQQLPDGSMLVGTSEPSGPDGSYFASTGRLVRLVDVDNDGVADGAPAVLADRLDGTLTDVRVVGRLVFVSAAARSILVLRAGVAPADPYTFLGRVDFAFPAGWEHGHYATAVRPAPGGGPATYELFFNVGSRENATTTPDDVSVGVSGLLAGTVQGDSIYKVTVRDARAGAPVFTDLTRVARGLRNAAGLAFHPNTGDLYFEDNGIDHPANRSEPLSADELNRLPVANIGGAVEDFGFADDYVEYRTGRRVGTGGVEPLVAFQPLPPDASESEGPAQIAFAPAAFPAAVNDGVFVGFHGMFGASGIRNEENPLAYYDLRTGRYVHFVSNDLPTIGHLDGLLATSDSLFVADLTPDSDFSATGTGVIYQIKVVGHPTAASVTTRYVATDGGTFTSGRAALLPGQAATLNNVTSDSRGISSIVVDVRGLPTGTAPTAADFDVRVGTSNNPGAWAAVPEPPQVTVRRGDGAGGSDRITLAWPGRPQRNTWLQVTVKATARTGLASPDVFYFGSLPGDSGNATGSFAVNAADVLRTRSRLGATNPAALAALDFNHDGVVNARDLAVVRANHGRVLPAFAAPAQAGGRTVRISSMEIPARTITPLARRGVWEGLVSPSGGLR